LNRLETNHILSNSEKNSFEKDTILKKSGWHDFYWFSNGFLSLEWYRFFRYARFLENSWQPINTFSSYNRILKDRDHRLIISNFLYNNFQNKILLSCHFDSNFTPSATLPDYQKKYINGINSNLYINVKSNTVNKSFDIDTDDFTNSFCHIVTERIFYEDRIHLTEKIFRPIVCCRPFILVSSPNALQYLKNYGFKTFNDYWSEDYDNIHDHNSRLDAILDIIQYIGSLNNKQILEMLNSMKEVLIFNRNHFYNEFEKIITDELYTNLFNSINAKNKETCYYSKIFSSLTKKEFELIKNTNEVCDEINDTTSKIFVEYIKTYMNNKPKDENVIRPFVKENLKHLRGFYLGYEFKNNLKAFDKG
jgi:hypothetical protein